MTGKRAALQASAAYPLGFCNLLAELLLQHLHARFELKTLSLDPWFAKAESPAVAAQLVSLLMSYV